MTPAHTARLKIDELLTGAGRELPDRDALNRFALTGPSSTAPPASLARTKEVATHAS